MRTKFVEIADEKFDSAIRDLINTRRIYQRRGLLKNIPDDVIGKETFDKGEFFFLVDGVKYSYILFLQRKRELEKKMEVI